MNSSNLRELELHGKYLGSPAGSSMEPLFYDKKNVVEIVRADGPLRKLDIALYVRKDGTSVLHRVIGVAEGAYVMCGDNCITPEVVQAEQVAGVCTRFYRNGKWISTDDRGYRVYANVWSALLPVRRHILRARRIWRRGKEWLHR